MHTNSDEAVCCCSTYGQQLPANTTITINNESEIAHFLLTTRNSQFTFFIRTFYGLKVTAFGASPGLLEIEENFCLRCLNYALFAIKRSQSVIFPICINFYIVKDFKTYDEHEAKKVSTKFLRRFRRKFRRDWNLMQQKSYFTTFWFLTLEIFFTSSAEF